MTDRDILVFFVDVAYHCAREAGICAGNALRPQDYEHAALRLAREIEREVADEFHRRYRAQGIRRTLGELFAADEWCGNDEVTKKLGEAKAALFDAEAKAGFIGTCPMGGDQPKERAE